MTKWAERQERADAEWRMERHTAEQVACPWCGELAGQTCRSKFTGEVLKKAPSHWQRLHAATRGVDLDPSEGPS